MDINRLLHSTPAAGAPCCGRRAARAGAQRQWRAARRSAANAGSVTVSANVAG